jgi:hypothetical protein
MAVDEQYLDRDEYERVSAQVIAAAARISDSDLLSLADDLHEIIRLRRRTRSWRRAPVSLQPGATD